MCLGCLEVLNMAADALCSKIYQAWGAGRSVVSEKDKKEVSLLPTRFSSACTD